MKYTGAAAVSMVERSGVWSKVRRSVQWDPANCQDAAPGEAWLSDDLVLGATEIL